MPSSLLGDYSKNNIDTAVNSDKIELLLLLPSFIDHGLSTTTYEHIIATSTASASCLCSICILMQSNKDDDINVNDFMNDIIFYQHLFLVCKWLLLIIMLLLLLKMMEIFLLR